MTNISQSKKKKKKKKIFFLKKKVNIASFTESIKQNIYVMDKNMLSQGQVKIKTGTTRKQNHTFTSIHASPQVIPRIHVIL
jgi:hypothetical protein